MKKFMKVCLTSVLLCGFLIVPVSAEEDESIPEGFESERQYQEAPDYFEPERVAAREAKIRQMKEGLPSHSQIDILSLCPCGLNIQPIIVPQPVEK